MCLLFYHSTATTHASLSSFISRIIPCVAFTPLLYVATLNFDDLSREELTTDNQYQKLVTAHTNHILLPT